MNTPRHDIENARVASGSRRDAADPAVIEAAIDQQRDHIAELVQALESRLSPTDLVGRLLGSGKEGGREFASNLGDAVKAHPVPTLVTAAGLAWLFASQHRANVPAATGDQTKTHLRDKLGATKEHATEAARRRARQLNSRFHGLLDENPMAIGAMGIAAGAMLGAVLPSTRKERELMGEASERWLAKQRPAASTSDEPRAGAARASASRSSWTGGDSHLGGLHPGDADLSPRGGGS